MAYPSAAAGILGPPVKINEEKEKEKASLGTGGDLIGPPVPEPGASSYNARPVPGGFGSWDEYNTWRRGLRDGTRPAASGGAQIDGGPVRIPGAMRYGGVFNPFGTPAMDGGPNTVPVLQPPNTVPFLQPPNPIPFIRPYAQGGGLRYNPQQQFALLLQRLGGMY